MRHYRVIGSEPLSGETVCGTKGSLTPMVRLVTCPACLDWIAKNFSAVTAAVKARRSA